MPEEKIKEILAQAAKQMRQDFEAQGFFGEQLEEMIKASQDKIQSERLHV